MPRRTLNVEATGFREVMLAAKEFDPALAAAVRRKLRKAANEAANKVRAEIRNAPVKGEKVTGLREQIAQGVKVQVATGTRKAGVFIRVSSNLARAYDRPQGWRHPVFGHDTWVTQHGHPYFASVLNAERERLRAAVVEALDEATRAIDRGKLL